MEISREYGISHPYIVVVVKEMIDKGILSSRKSTTDKRKSYLSLTSKGKIMINPLKTVWDKVAKRINEIYPSSEFIIQ